jgi:aspartyl-tRNA(Asn)/glutamyl-tRNA(Gln) amidotransferase subunit C
MDREKVLNIAKLARIRLSDEEAENLSHEFEAILNYVGEVKGAVKGSDSQERTPGNYPVRNVMREDGKGHDSGLYTEKLLAEAPGAERNYFKVKKIL